jgi:6-phosphogluconolactonase
MKKILVLSFTAVCFIAGFAQSKSNYLLVGTYTSGASKGIYVYRFSTASGDFDSVSMIKTNNPSFLAISPDQKFVYAVHEIAQGGNGGEIAAFSFSKQTGELTFINQQLSGGDHPCYVAVDKTGKWVAAANYSSGSLSVLPVNKNGGLEPASTIIQHVGSSVNVERQKGPHTHSSVFSPDNNYLFSADLGIDKLMFYRFNAATGKLSDTNFVMTEPGAGPRHFTFHPKKKIIYLVEELSGSVVAYGYSKTGLKLLQTISAVPRDYEGPMGSADIHISPDGKFLYASNRGESNTIAIFKTDPRTGWLQLIGHQSTMGKTPRNFNFDPTGNFLLVANQNSDEVVIFKRNKTTGLLSDTGKRIKVGNPVCLKWISE